MEGYVYTIVDSDVGNTHVFGSRGRSRPLRAIHVASAIGRIQAIDVGKRVYETLDGVIQVESDSQRDARI